MNNKQTQPKVDITQLTGSPSPTGVSEVAMGGKSQTLMAHDETAQGQWIGRLMGMPKEQMTAMQQIQQAYAQLFEGLAGLAKCSMGCVGECQHGEENDNGDSEPDDSSPQEPQEQEEPVED